ncbi:hypothetical protein J6590_062552 [Homalodisca vitripennis]|nr:hypothetical protein J6590_062552 [Homalodisca vitripennis]
MRGIESRTVARRGVIDVIGKASAFPAVIAFDNFLLFIPFLFGLQRFSTSFTEFIVFFSKGLALSAVHRPKHMWENKKVLAKVMALPVGMAVRGGVECNKIAGSWQKHRACSGVTSLALKAAVAVAVAVGGQFTDSLLCCRSADRPVNK